MKRFMLHALSTLAMEIPQVPCACTIAGSDPSGGAGIQSDIKTFSALGVWGLSVITALTSQNANNVRGIWNVPEDVIRLQLVTLLEDFDIRAFKTGMLYDEGYPLRDTPHRCSNRPKVVEHAGFKRPNIKIFKKCHQL